MTSLTRRDFLRVSLLAGGAMLVEACTRGAIPAATTTTSTVGTTSTTAGATTTSTHPPDPGAVFEPNLWVTIDGTGAVVLTGHRSELGQGILTAMAMILADELDADWSAVTVRQADLDERYGSQSTGGSTSITQTYDVLRAAGAEARHRLVAAAAARWGADPQDLTTEAGVVHDPTGGRSAPYGHLVAEAAALDPAELGTPRLKEPGDFHLIGTPAAVTHTAAVLDGSATYAADLTLPGMRTAVVSYPPAPGMGPPAFDPGGALGVEGVEAVVEITNGVAVVASDTWAALEGREALAVSWGTAAGGGSSADLLRMLRRRVSGSSAVYEHPFYAHASIEPQCCVAALDGSTCEVWAGVQDPAAAREAAVAAAGPGVREAIVHLPLSGGRFGRGHRVDHVGDAVEIAAAVGAPVKLFWSREDDFHRDALHPLNVLGADSDPADPLATITIDRRFARRTEFSIGAWRSVRHHSEAFAHESYFDEIAHDLGLDPVEARLRVLGPRAAAVVRTAAEAAGWGDPLPAGWGRGIAQHATWDVTQTAQVAEVSVESGTIRVHRVVCAVDCGRVINPEGVRIQLEGAVVWGLTAALGRGIDVEDGRIVQGNYDDYPILRFDETPVIEVHILPSDAHPSGIGEMGVPPLAPAVANAVFDATGVRLRSLPLRFEGRAGSPA